MIDPHVHLRDGIQKDKETILHGLAVASSCLFDWIFDMPNCDPPLTTEKAIRERLALADNACGEIFRQSGRMIRYSLYAGLTDHEEQICEMVGMVEELFPQVVALKLFAGNSTGGMGIITKERQRMVYRTLAKCGYRGVLAVHAEKESLFRPDLEDPSDFSTHCLARPEEAEVESVRDQIALAWEEGFEGNLHICHISVPASVALVEQARKDGMRITCGATPHHLLLDSDDAADRSLYAKMNPPLRKEETRRGLFSLLLQGKIDWVESDHAPHTLADKEKGAGGIPGFSGMLLLLERLERMHVDPDSISAWFGGNVQRTFSLDPFPVSLPDSGDLAELAANAAKQYPYDSYKNIQLIV